VVGSYLFACVAALRLRLSCHLFRGLTPAATVGRRFAAENGFMRNNAHRFSFSKAIHWCRSTSLLACPPRATTVTEWGMQGAARFLTGAARFDAATNEVEMF